MSWACSYNGGSKECMQNFDEQSFLEMPAFKMKN
jgi:hypothetical protein